MNPLRDDHTESPEVLLGKALPPKIPLPQGAVAPPPRRPWDRLDAEKVEAFHAFLRYRDLGPNRTIAEAFRTYWAETNPEAEPPKTGPAPWAYLARRFRWDERCLAWDRYMQRAQDKGRARVQQTREAQRARQALKADDESIAAAQQLKIKAFQMLQWSLEEVVEETRTLSEDGRTILVTKTIQPGKWTFRDAASMLKVARELEESVFGARDDPQRQAEEARQEQAEAPPPDAIRATAGRMVARWRDEQRRGMITSDAPPPTPSGASDDPIDVESPQDGPGDVDDV